jgi:cytochrome c biogenesis protein
MKSAWKLFGSVRLAIILIILIAAASVLGTLVPQHRPAAEYLVRFGNAGKLVAPLGLDRLYQSPGFLGLLVLFAVNISVCTLVRLPSRIRRIFGTGWASEPRIFEGWKTRGAFARKGAPADIAAAAEAGLRRRRYRIRRKDDGPAVLLRGMRNAAGAFGADLVHFGLLVVIAGGVTSGLGGFKTDVALTEGRTGPIGTGGLELRLDRFGTDYYPGGSVKGWRSEVAVLRGGRVLASGAIEVNHPLSAGGMMFYQSGYGRDWDNPVLGLSLRKKSDPAFRKSLSLKPGESADAGDGITIAALRFVPDFIITGGNQVSTRSLEPRNPAALIEIRKSGAKPDSAWVFSKYPDFTHFREAAVSDLGVELADFQAPEYSVILAARDPGAPVIWTGCALIMAGLFLSFYRPVREIRISILPGPGSSASVAAGGLAAKSREILDGEFAEIMSELRRPR